VTSVFFLFFCSFAPWFEIFYKILNYINELASKSGTNEVTVVLQDLYDQNVPTANESIPLGKVWPPANTIRVAFVLVSLFFVF